MKTKLEIGQKVKARFTVKKKKEDFGGYTMKETYYSNPIVAYVIGKVVRREGCWDGDDWIDRKIHKVIQLRKSLCSPILMAYEDDLELIEEQ